MRVRREGAPAHDALVVHHVGVARTAGGRRRRRRRRRQAAAATNTLVIHIR